MSSGGSARDQGKNLDNIQGKNEGALEKNQLKLNKISKDELAQRDVFGRTILHIAILYNETDNLQKLVKNPNFKNILQSLDYENGWNCMHYIIHYKRVQCFTILVKYLQGVTLQNLFLPNGPFIELLKCKDRSGLTPIQLMDIKSFDPLYIRADNEFCFKKDMNRIGKFGTTINGGHNFGNENENENENEEEDVDEDENAQHVSKKFNEAKSTKRHHLYVFGSNLNNQLGSGDTKDRIIPSKINNHESFSDVYDNIGANNLQSFLQTPCFQDINITKHHSMVLTTKGEIFTAGHGSRGRLGQGNEKNCSTFKKLEFFNDIHGSYKRVVLIATSNNHSLALTSSNEVFAWGLNSFNQLGVNSSKKVKSYLDDFISSPILVGGELRKLGEKILGIAVSKIHSVAWSKNQLFSWGLNVGQMGISCAHGDIEIKLNNESWKGEVQSTPKVTFLRDEIKLVSTSELCTCVVTVMNDIHVYYNYQHYKLPKIKVIKDHHFDIFKPRKLTMAAVVTKVVTRGPDTTMLLLSGGSVLSFSISNNNNSNSNNNGNSNNSFIGTANTLDIKNTKYSTVWKPHSNDMIATDIDVANDGSLVLCTKSGAVYLKPSTASSTTTAGAVLGGVGSGSLGHRRGSLSAVSLPINFVSKNNKFKKIEGLNRIIKVHCDLKFASFAFVREDIMTVPLELAMNDFYDDLKLLSPASEFIPHRKQQQLTEHLCDTYITSFMNSGKDHQRVQLQSQSLKGFAASSYALCLEDDENLYLEKGYDSFIMVKDTKIPFHKDILKYMSRAFKEMLDEANDLIIGDTFSAQWDYDKSAFLITSKETLPQSVLCFVHSLYDPLFKLERSSVSNVLFDEYMEMCKVFGIKPHNDLSGMLFEKQEQEQEESEDEDEDEVKDNEKDKVFSFNDGGDVEFTLQDGSMRAHSFLLAARSAFFETILSNRWKNSMQVDTLPKLDFSGVSKKQMKILLLHLYGVPNCDLLNMLGFDSDLHLNLTLSLSLSSKSYKDNHGIKANKMNEVDIINELLELMEIADELLLYQLQEMLELALCEMIYLDNVLELAVYADMLKAWKLFMNCCWYIYNNLEVLVFDSSMLDVPSEVLSKIESQCKVFDTMAVKQFTNKDEQLQIGKETSQNRENKVNEEKTLASSLQSQFVIPGTRLFVENLLQFNEIFMSDRKGYSSFEPLVDARLEVKKVKEPTKRRKSRKSSSASSASLLAEIKEFRDNYTWKEIGNNKASDPRLAMLARTSASLRRLISDLPFNREKLSPPVELADRSGKSLTVKGGTATATATATAAAATTTTISDPASFLNATGSSTTSLPSVSNAVKTKSTISTTPIFNETIWKPQEPTDAPSPLLIKPLASTLDIKPENSKQYKPRIGPHIKLSQKERKKLVAASAGKERILDKLKPEAISGSSVAPWANTSANTSNDQINTKFPVLGVANGSSSGGGNGGSNGGSNGSSTKNKKLPIAMSTKRATSPNGSKSPNDPYSGNMLYNSSNSSFSSVYSTPSLAEVKAFKARDDVFERMNDIKTTTKTLSEIKQEQEFEKWWQEESKRVQREMGIVDDTTLDHKGKNGSSKSRNKQAAESEPNSGSSLKSKSKSQSKSKLQLKLQLNSRKEPGLEIELEHTFVSQPRSQSRSNGSFSKQNGEKKLPVS
ncbi:hypothetical protein LELG_05203 [Lodderomyces elongisporus NRRL YB-4239]|uniref:BTB domain-containing protein n=1 Tax=Lodderomyces elongisporus (strain ATCC 11503 / CBS 2605 / JCM 1781 / NBRC 1676 / NRRL YB-4239) TaxID=379508 RepID=A5E6G4_LODEL|nr:hypothetical protein LELG_05203 [Lodderomyces elongisporus NRRL YB-4239]